MAGIIRGQVGTSGSSTTGKFEPPRPPASTVINGKTYVSQPNLPQYDLYGNPINRSFNAGAMTGQDGSTWNPMATPNPAASRNPLAPSGTGGTGGNPLAPAGSVDPRIAQLYAQLSQNVTIPTVAGPDFSGITPVTAPTVAAPDFSGITPITAPNVAAPDFSGIQGQQQQLQARLSELLAGRGIDVGDVSTNPEAVANRVAVERAATQQQQAEAERLAASGMTGSGESDARNAQIREQTGTQVAGFNAGLAGRLRSEAQAGAIQGAGLSLNDLSQQMAQQQALYGARVNTANAATAATSANNQTAADKAMADYNARITGANATTAAATANNQTAADRAMANYNARVQGANTTTAAAQEAKSRQMALLQLLLQQQRMN